MDHLNAVQLFAAVGFPIAAIFLGFYLWSEIKRVRAAEARARKRRQERGIPENAFLRPRGR